MFANEEYKDDRTYSVNLNPHRMIIEKKFRIILFMACLSAFMYGCTKKWDVHTDITDPNLRGNLFERLSQNTNLSEFNKLLVKSGYDKVLASSKTFTVWAPDNAALANLAPEIINDSAKLNQFIANHIALSAFSNGTAADTVVVKMLDDKNLDFTQGFISDAHIVTANQYASNGLYHIIDKALTPRLNIWEYILSTVGTYQQNSFINSLSSINIFPADSQAVNIGLPQFDNEFLKKGYNLQNEEGKFTYFVMADDAFEAEKTKLLPYLIRGSQDSTQNLSAYYAVRDMVFEGAYTRENLPDTLVSQFGIKVLINKSAIIGEPVLLSNGIVYVMNNMDVRLEDRLVTTTIQGELPVGFSQNDKRSNTFYREKEDSLGVLFNDIMMQNHGVPLFGINYRATNLYSTTYHVYWRAINDIQTNVFQQRLRVGGTVGIDGTVTNPLAFFPYTNVELNNYNEVYIGDFTLPELRDVNMTLIAANSGTNGNNTLTLDYIKLVPVIK
jgi:uncharacterized surface protein with fasciclin (FAS1) repeats